MRRVFLLLLFATPAAAAPDFDRDIAPLLARRCLDCHSGPEPKGELDLSRRQPAMTQVTPGKPAASALWTRVRDGEMPPKKPLPPAERKLLEEWIASGAKWGGDPIDPFRATTDSRAGYDWWALRPVARPVPPSVKATPWVRNAIDRFVLARLEERKLVPSPEADRRTLIRRLTFDLLGLPPTPEEVEAFTSDSAADAYEKLVARLLASPRHGERWARHWLDIVRFGESDGFERDLPRLTAWPYRDWVVNALNADLGYDDFVRLQLAGDVLKPGDADALAAAGFLVAGPHDIVVPVAENMKATMRQDELEDIVGTVGQAFLGLTVACARCHDHKFDPVSMRDYYAIVSALSGVGFGERPVPGAATAELARLAGRLAKLRQEVAGIDSVRRKLLAEKRKEPNVGPRPLAEWDFTADLDDRIGKMHAKLSGSAKRDGSGLKLDGKTGFVRTAPLAKSLTAKSLEVWVRLDSLKQRGGGAITLQTLDGHTFDAIVFGEQQPGRWMAGSDSFRRTRDLAGPEEKEGDGRLVHVALTYAADGTITAYRDGRPYGRPYRIGPVQSFDAGKAEVVFGLRHGTSPTAGRMLTGVVSRARLYDRALSAKEVAASAGVPVVGEEEVAAALSEAERKQYRALISERIRLESRRDAITKANTKLYTVNPSQPPVTHLLARGAVTAKREVVPPEVPAALASRLGETKLRPDAPEGQRRVALAKWISDAQNPLFARVAVNRLWHYHFGVGLVETTSDFGFNGSRPSHPELLDFLADELVRSQFSLKAVHRLIVTSAAYRQSSAPRREASAIDAENRLLWRKTPMRLEAEAVRDAVLAVSGQLDSRLGGEPYLDFATYFFKGTQFYDPLEQVGVRFTRRSLYRMWARGGRSPLLDTLDCPDPSTATPRRARTTTPLQALALFNNAFVLDQADRLADRARADAGDDVTRQVARVYALAYGRPPTPRESALLTEFVRENGLAALARVVFNTGEFVQVE